MHRTGPSYALGTRVRFTHLDLAKQRLTFQQAQAVYDRWLENPRVGFYPEPRGMDSRFREATAPLAGKAASKWVGDCYLLAYAAQSHAALATFDKALYDLAGRDGCPAIIPG